jgi:hypothetical protein
MQPFARKHVKIHTSTRTHAQALAYRVESANDAVVGRANEALAAAIEANGIDGMLGHFHLGTPKQETEKKRS